MRRLLKRITTWIYRPAKHKNSHRDQDRTIYFNTKSQAILTPYLDRGDTENCFKPSESVAHENVKKRGKRKSKVQPSQVSRKKPNPKRKPGQRWRKDSYCNAVARSAKKAGVEPWHPNQIRHTVATDVRKRDGLEAAQAVLGNSTDAIKIYAERDEQVGIDAAKKIG